MDTLTELIMLPKDQFVGQPQSVGLGLRKKNPKNNALSLGVCYLSYNYAKTTPL